MSYLDVPRLHFAGTFTADPSTINNDIKNYDPSHPKDLSWNPYGSHAWTIAATVTSFLDSGGRLYRDGDPLLGAAFESYLPPGQAVAKMADQDTQQQGRTRLYGLYLRLVAPPAGGGPAATTMLESHFMDRATLLNLWVARVPAKVETDTGSGGAFQSVLEDLVWQASGSPLLNQLRQASPDGLSIRLSCYGYLSEHANPGFTSGSIVGTIGPWRPEEPKFNVIDRMLNPPPTKDPSLLPTTSAPLWYAPVKVDRARSTATIDMGNSVPEESPGGTPIQLGRMELVVLPPDRPPIVLGEVDYSKSRLQLTAGVTEFTLPALYLNFAMAHPLAVSCDAKPTLTEAADGTYVEVERATVTLDPFERDSVYLYATAFGQPKPGHTVQLKLVPQDSAAAILQVMRLSESDPPFMPVTREMSRAQRNLVVTWLEAGCPQ